MSGGRDAGPDRVARCPAMTRSLSLTLFLLLLATVGVAIGVAWLISKDQAALVDQFARERRAQLLEATHTVEESLDEIADDLRLATELISQPGSPDDHRRELRALLEAVGQYKAIAFYAPDGTEQVRLVDRRAPTVFDDTTLLERLRTTGREALRQSEEAIVISPPLGSSSSGWVRAFARALPTDEDSAGGAIAVLVDTESSFASLRLLTADPDTKMLVIGSNGAAMPMSDARLVRSYLNVEDPRHSLPQFADIVRRMRASEEGNVRLDDAEATQLGLGDADAVATFAPIQVKGGGDWHVVVLTSTRILRTQQHTLIVRMSLAAVLVVLFLTAFAIHVLIANRRAAELRATQHHATRLAQLHEKLVQAEKLATVGVLAAGIAHEIGTPLGVVRGHAEYILGKLGPRETLAPGLRTIIEQIDRVCRTLRQLLDFSRPQAAHVRATDLRNHIQGLRQLLGVEAQRKGLTLQWELPEKLPLLAADPDQLEQVLVNLALNAIDACPEQGLVQIRASASQLTEGEEVEISVEDNGCGIAAEHLHQVFDPFFTTKKRGQGTGLGLTVVAQIVRSHGGRVELTSDVGNGTCVRVSWPSAGAPLS